MEIEYKTDQKLSPEQFISILMRSTPSERRPVDDLDCIESMLKHANLLVTAWDGTRLVGVARSVTDFSYCCDYQTWQLIRNIKMQVSDWV